MKKLFTIFAGLCITFLVSGLRQLRSHKTSYKIAGSRLNSGFFSVKSCQIL